MSGLGCVQALFSSRCCQTAGTGGSAKKNDVAATELRASRRAVLASGILSMWASAPRRASAFGNGFPGDRR